MKAYLAIFLSMCTTLTMRAQSDSLGLPGDDLNLCGVLELFKTAKSPDDFEKALNKKDKKINNLDLNEDGEVDYLRVIDNSKGDAHALVIQSVLDKNEAQDVAVIEIEKRGDKNAQLQIVGDEHLYGKDYIIEPKNDQDATDKHWQGFAPPVFVMVNVWYWPAVSYMWYPDYVVWVSPWYWGYYPSWYYPWAPMPYYSYYQYVYGYNSYYYWTNDYRMTDAHNVYQPRRVASSNVGGRTAPARQQAERQTPRRANGQSAVPARRPTEKDKTTPAPRRDAATPAPQRSNDVPPAPRQDQRDAPAPREERTNDVPAPAPAPRQDRQDVPKAPRNQSQPPAPRQRPDVHSAPAPRPAPSPRPAPAPRAPQGSRPR